MSPDPVEWRNLAPGDLSRELSLFRSGDVEAAVARSVGAFPAWAGLTLDQRREFLEGCRERVAARSEALAEAIALEVGKPLREARLEMAAAVAKFDLTFRDGERFLREEAVETGPHPAAVRRCPRGPAAVIAPFNFPVHLGHGATVAYLLAGNTVIFKPSPLAVGVGAMYAAAMQEALPAGVFEFVPGWGAVGRDLSLHPAVRAVCFTGSIPVGTALARDLAADYSKSLALELGGKCSVLVWSDADLEAAAAAVADGACLTAGQRCNATSRVIVHEAVREEFLARLRTSLTRYVPGSPLAESTLLGPLVSAAAVDRYRELTSLNLGEWIVSGSVPDDVEGRRGYYVSPAVLECHDPAGLDASLLATRESFVPVLVVESVADAPTAVARHEAWKFGLTASIFTADDEVFETIGRRLNVGNLYRNLPTTFSPSTLPFGGWGASGNGRPGGQGFVRFAVDEQAVQWKP